MPALLTNKSLINNLVYTLPIYIYASTNIQILISSVDSLIHQPGIVQKQITILHWENNEDIESKNK